VPPPAADSDGDGLSDPADNCPDVPNLDQVDLDEDGIGDACDSYIAINSDGDGWYDPEDACPFVYGTSTVAPVGCPDTDGDGWADTVDACPNDPGKIEPGVCGCGNPEDNPDGDLACGAADGCPNDPGKVAPGICGCGIPDADSDGDGALDCRDNCLSVANPTQVDTDGDGMGDGCDTDDDNDGVADGADNCPLAYNPNQIDTDSDGIGNICDSTPCYIEIGLGPAWEIAPPPVLSGANGGRFRWISPTWLINLYPPSWRIWQNGIWYVGYHGDCSPLGIGPYPPDNPMWLP